MIVCPVCEHPQAQGDVCDVCGKQLVASWGSDAPPVQVMAELEHTQLPGAGAATVAPVTRMAELEASRLQAGPDLPSVPMAEMERTGNAPVGNTPVLPLDEMDLGRAEVDGLRTAAPSGPLVCRYCRHEQAEGLFCDACGMRLPKAITAPAAAATGLVGDEPLWVICQKCGSRAQVGRRCGSCGITVAMP